MQPHEEAPLTTYSDTRMCAFNKLMSLITKKWFFENCCDEEENFLYETHFN